MQGVKIFTIVTKSYLAYAKALAMKVEEFHPGASFTIFVVDPEGMVDQANGTIAEIRSADDLFEDETFRLMTGYYTADELCNACKPWAHAALLRESSTNTTLYLDSDVFLTGSLGPLLEDLGNKAILLTPHVIKPIPGYSNEALDRAFLHGGIYNGGCLGFKRSPEAYAFIAWWKERLRYQCLRGEPSLCVDQSWLNFIPAFFPDRAVTICRRPGVNVGHWNMHERELRINDSGDFFADGLPATFIHFSGWDWNKPEVPSRYALTAAGASRDAWAKAGIHYRDLLVRLGIAESSRMDYSFGRARDGRPITIEMRRRYLEMVKTRDTENIGGQIPSIFSCPELFEVSYARQPLVALWEKVAGMVKSFLHSFTSEKRNFIS
jgi:hypothetical protein